MERDYRDAASRTSYDFAEAKSGALSLVAKLLAKPLEGLRKKSNPTEMGLLFFGADYGARTRHLHLGKVALYQMS